MVNQNLKIEESILYEKIVIMRLNLDIILYIVIVLLFNFFSIQTDSKYIQ